jgi:hypothetical protein
LDFGLQKPFHFLSCTQCVHLQGGVEAPSFAVQRLGANIGLDAASLLFVLFFIAIGAIALWPGYYRK